MRPARSVRKARTGPRADRVDSGAKTAAIQSPRQPLRKGDQTPAEVLQEKLNARESLLEREKDFTFMTLLGQDGAWRLQSQAGD